MLSNCRLRLSRFLGRKVSLCCGCPENDLSLLLAPFIAMFAQVDAGINGQEMVLCSVFWQRSQQGLGKVGKEKKSSGCAKCLPNVSLVSYCRYRR